MDVKYTGENTLAALIAEVIDRFASKNDIAHLLPVPATSTDGVAYTATVPGVTELYNGLIITIIPNMTSASTAITLDVNGLGAKYVRLPLSFNNAAMSIPKLATYYTEGRPITLQFDANYTTNGAWKTLGKQRTSAQDLYGVTPVESGGTGADNAAEARTNLGIQDTVDTVTADGAAPVSGAAVAAYVAEQINAITDYEGSEF